MNARRRWGRHRLARHVLAIAFAAGAGGCASGFERSPGERLQALWSQYKHAYMVDSGAVHDPLRADRVTSEAQSYALLQSAWLGDERAFHAAYTWTNEHLRRPDGLFSWLWDPRGHRIVDANSATDADTDIAFALLVAASAFNRADYVCEAARLVKAVRERTAISFEEGWFPSAGNWAGAERIVNLSYFAPYEYDYFEALDPDGGWQRVTAAGYALLEQATRDNALPADFAVLTPAGGIALLPATSGLSREFSFDAVRIPWRIDLDCRLHRRAAGCREQALVHRLEEILARDGTFVSRYSIRGERLTHVESLSFYGALLPVLARNEPQTAATWRRTRLSDRALRPLHDSPRTRYYDANWVWFGLAAADGLIVTRTPTVAEIARLAARC
jgi:endo-1,4-beta-D-glucanase Y